VKGLGWGVGGLAIGGGQRGRRDRTRPNEWKKEGRSEREATLLLSRATFLPVRHF
jgi:hypothetical protein